MISLILFREVAADMSELNGSLFNVYKYFEFLAYFILAFVVLQLILFILFIASLLSENTREAPRGDIVHPTSIKANDI